MNNPDEISYIHNEPDSKEVIINHFRKDLIVMLESLVEVLGDRPYYQIKSIFCGVLVSIYKHRYRTNTAGCKKLGINRTTFRRLLSKCNG